MVALPTWPTRISILAKLTAQGRRDNAHRHRLLCGLRLYPGFAVGQIVLTWVLNEPFVERSNEPSSIGSGEVIRRGHEYEAEVSLTARRDEFKMQWSEVAQVHRDNCTPFSPCHRGEVGISKTHPGSVFLDCLDVMATLAQRGRVTGDNISSSNSFNA